MSHSTIDTWHHAVKHRNPAGLDDLLADDAVFLSPIVHAPQCGKALTKIYLQAAFGVFFNPSFRYVRELVGEHDAMLEFETEIDSMHAFLLRGAQMAGAQDRAVGAGRLGCAQSFEGGIARKPRHQPFFRPSR